MQETLSSEDENFLNHFFGEELTEEKMKELDRRMECPIFKEKYNQLLNLEYDQPKGKIFINYLPMIIMVLLVLVGAYLCLNIK